MADPTADEVAAAIATLAAFERAREAAVNTGALAELMLPSKNPEPVPVVPVAEASESPAPAEASEIPPPPAAPAVEETIPVAPAVDPYIARSVKSSPNGF